MEKGKIDFAHFSSKNPKANWTLDAVNTKTTQSNPYKTDRKAKTWIAKGNDRKYCYVDLISS